MVPLHVSLIVGPTIRPMVKTNYATV